MGILKEEMIESQITKRNAKLAEILNLSIDELEECVYKLQEVENKDGLVTSLIVQFWIGVTPPEIFQKIKGLNDMYQVWLEPNALEGEREA